MKKALLSVMVIILFSANIFAYDNEKVHQRINENASLQSSYFISAMKALVFKGQLPIDIVEPNFFNGGA